MEFAKKFLQVSISPIPLALLLFLTLVPDILESRTFSLPGLCQRIQPNQHKLPFSSPLLCGGMRSVRNLLPAGMRQDREQNHERGY
jgi:hypothetical protein